MAGSANGAALVRSRTGPGAQGGGVGVTLDVSPREGVPRVAVHELGDQLLREPGRSHGRHELLGDGAIVLRQVPDTGPNAVHAFDLEACRLTGGEPTGARPDDDVVLEACIDQLTDPG